MIYSFYHLSYADNKPFKQSYRAAAQMPNRTVHLLNKNYTKQDGFMKNKLEGKAETANFSNFTNSTYFTTTETSHGGVLSIWSDAQQTHTDL